VDSQPGLRPRFCPRVGQLDRVARLDDASVASLGDHLPQRIKINRSGSQHGVEVGHRIR
jgi:hypothetical protein